MTCEKCGALVGDADRHGQWHLVLETLEVTAEDALDRAADAQNTLYQNNIST